MVAGNSSFPRHLAGQQLPQARGEDFFNVFALATPTGEIAGRVPKQQAASVEGAICFVDKKAHTLSIPISDAWRRYLL